MEDFRFNGKTRFGHFYDVTDKEEQILFHRCSLRVEAYIKAHVYNQEDVYNLRQEVLLKVVEGLNKSYHEKGHFFQWVMTIAINMVNDYYRRKKNAPNMVTLDNENMLLVLENTHFEREGFVGVLSVYIWQYGKCFSCLLCLKENCFRIFFSLV